MRTTNQRDRRAATARPPLRVWPGVVAAGLLVAGRVGFHALMPGFEGFQRAMLSGFGASALILLWWLLASRAAWLERLGVVALMGGAVAATWQLKHASMSAFWLLAYAVPGMMLALVVGACLGRGLGDGPRRLTVVAAVLLATCSWLFVRTAGVDGNHVSSFGWRFAASAEEQLLERSPARPGSVAAIPAPATVEATWPGFRGPDRDGVVRGARVATDWNATPPVELWRRPVGPGWSSFAVRGDLIYTQEQLGDEEIVSCYRASSGEPVWQHRDPVRFFESMAGPGPRATPVVHGDRVVSLGATGIVNALDAVTGARAWTRDAGADTGTAIPDWGFSGSPLVIGDRVVVPASGTLIAYDLATGEPRWTGPAFGVSYTSPTPVTLGGVGQILMLGGKGAFGIAAADGTVLWEHPWPGFPMIQPIPLPGGDLVITVSSDSGIRRLTVDRGAAGWSLEERWTSNALKPYFNGFVVHRGHGYGFDGRILACIDLATGERTWKGGRYGHGQLVLLADQDLLLVLSERGEIALVEAEPGGFRELARIPAISGKTWNHPVVVGDRLLVRNDREMAAFRLPPA